MTNSAADRRSPLGLFSGQPKPRLYDCVLEALRSRPYSRRTEEAYLHGIRRFLAFHNGTRPGPFYRGQPKQELGQPLVVGAAEYWAKRRLP
jgi:hypothetical protein